MSVLRRHGFPGSVYFITNVSYNRREIIIKNVDLLWTGINRVKERQNFKLKAYVFLPDHFHVIIDSLDCDISGLLQSIKMSFAANYRKRYGLESGRVWQHRFYDHMIRNQKDLNNHLNYIHYNPVKHGLVRNPVDWEHSSFGQYLKSGYYANNWGAGNRIEFKGEYGE